jgi:hypothetical protein
MKERGSGNSNVAGARQFAPLPQGNQLVEELTLREVTKYAPRFGQILLAQFGCLKNLVNRAVMGVHQAAVNSDYGFVH